MYDRDGRTVGFSRIQCNVIGMKSLIIILLRNYPYFLLILFFHLLLQKTKYKGDVFQQRNESTTNWTGKWEAVTLSCLKNLILHPTIWLINLNEVIIYTAGLHLFWLAISFYWQRVDPEKIKIKNILTRFLYFLITKLNHVMRNFPFIH